MKEKKTIKEKYDSLGGKLYDIRYSEEQQAKYCFIFNELNKQDLILDNGCGTGLFLSMLETTAIGIDISKRLLEKAIKRKKPNHHLIQGDSEFLPLRDAVFYAVVSVTVIQNLPHPEILAQESTRISKPSSVIIISSHKKVYSRDEITKLVLNDELSINKIYTSEKINDWIIVSTKIK